MHLTPRETEKLLIVVAADHFIRGVFWPQSVYGVLSGAEWRWLEHAGWVLFEDVFLIAACLRSQREMWLIAVRTAALGSDINERKLAEERLRKLEILARRP